MNRKFLLLNLVLVGLLVWIVWAGRQRWIAARSGQQAVLASAPAAKEQLPPPPAPGVQPAAASDYIDVAQRTLFSQDRDPNIYIEVPPPVIVPEPVMPPLPAYYGQMQFGDPIIFLSIGPEGQKAYRNGEAIGEFTITGFDRDHITLEWNGQSLERELEGLRPSEAALARAPRANGGAVPQAPAPQQGPVAPARAAAAKGGPRQTTAGAGIASSVAGRSNASAMGASAAAAGGQGQGTATLGSDVGGVRNCVPGDTSPAGTVVDGYRKVVNVGLMGPGCHWEPIE